MVVDKKVFRLVKVLRHFPKKVGKVDPLHVPIDEYYQTILLTMLNSANNFHFAYRIRKLFSHHHRHKSTCMETKSN